MKTLLILLSTSLYIYGQGAPVAITPYQVIDNSSGVSLPCVGCSIYTYAAGTTTPLATFTDASLTTPNTNPVLTNSSGYAVNGSTITGIWVGGSCYKFVLKNALSVTVWTQDNICNQAMLLAATLAGASGAGSLGFSQSASYSAGTVGQKLQGSASPKDAPFNALCDGTTDDEVALQSWLDSGPNLYLPAGVVCVTAAPLHTSVPRQTISGAGTIKANPTGLGGNALLTFRNKFDTVSGITFDGSGITPTGIIFYCASGSVLDNVTVTASAGDGILFSSSVGAGGDCGTNAGNNNYMTLINVRSISNGASGTGTGIDVATGDTSDNGVYFINCTVSDNGFDGYHEVTSSRWNILGGTVDNNWNYGIELASGSNHLVDNVEQSGNAKQGGGSAVSAQSKDNSTASLWRDDTFTSSTCYTNSNTCPVFLNNTSTATGISGSVNWFIQGGAILSAKSSVGGSLQVSSAGNVFTTGSYGMTLAGAADGYLQLAYPDTMSHTTMTELAPVSDSAVHTQIPTFAAIGHGTFGGITGTTGSTNVPLDGSGNPIPCNAFLPTSNHDPIGTLYQMVNVSDDGAAAGATYTSGGSKHAILACMGAGGWIVMVKEP